MRVLGQMRLYFNESGKINYAAYHPVGMQLQGVDSIADKLKSLEGITQEADLQKKALGILSIWFQQQNEVELADREKCGLIINVLYCEKWPCSEVPKKVILEIKIANNEKTNRAD